MQRLHINARADHVLRQAHRDQPVVAIAELVWNALDAEARHVDVKIERDAMDGVESVEIADDGHGIAPEGIAAAFEQLGGSWKAAAKLSPNLKRRLHGSTGQGRIRGFALGDDISWTTTADDTAGVRRRTIVSGSASSPTDFDPVAGVVVDGDELGTVFLAERPAVHVNRITADNVRSRITATFALFLTINPDVVITFDGAALDPVTAERHRADYPLVGVVPDGAPAPLLRIIEWETDAGRAIHLCDATGAVLETVDANVRAPGYNFTAYILWDGFTDRQADLPLADMQGDDLSDLLTVARTAIGAHFKTRDAERRAEQVRKWKDDGDYPYPAEPATEADRAERETFDFVATTVARKIPKSQLGRRSTLGLLKAVISSEPSAVPQILEQLMPLPKREQRAMADLLDRTPMSKLIEANTALTNKLDFLTAFREMVFDPTTSKLVKERKELHKILERELWVFGDEYSLLTSDRGLDEVLRRHLALLRPKTRRRATTTPVRRSDGSRGIVDLMLSQQRRGVTRREHLVVELKAPKVPITQREVTQLKSYADAVVGDPQFASVEVEWDFWVISTSLESTVKRDANQHGSPSGLISSWDGVRLWAKTWSELIDDCEARLRYFKDALEYDASREHAADYLERTYDSAIVPQPFTSPTE